MEIKENRAWITGRSANVHWFRSHARRGLDDLLQTAFRCLQLLFAMGFQSLSALVKRNGILQIDLTLLEL
jgi:hypothetical protein